MSKLVSDANLLQFGQAFKDNLSGVATSGSYTDLTDKPDLSTKANMNDSTQNFVAGDITTTTFTDDDQGETWKFPGGSSANVDHSIASEDYVDNAINDINSEVWTFTLTSDNSTVTKTVLLG